MKLKVKESKKINKKDNFYQMGEGGGHEYKRGGKANTRRWKRI